MDSQPIQQKQKIQDGQQIKQKNEESSEKKQPQTNTQQAADNSQPIIEGEKVQNPPAPIIKKKKNKTVPQVDNPDSQKLTCVVIINNSHHNMEVLTTHHSGAKVKTTFCSSYTKWVQEFRRKVKYSDPDIIDPIRTLSIHRMYYPEFTLFTLTEADWKKNEGKAWEIIRTKKQQSWNDYPEFAIIERERPERPKKQQNKL